MSNPTTLEKRLVIAVFMQEIEIPRGEIITPADLKYPLPPYHTDWNALMPLCIKRRDWIKSVLEQENDALYPPNENQLPHKAWVAIHIEDTIEDTFETIYKWCLDRNNENKKLKSNDTRNI